MTSEAILHHFDRLNLWSRGGDRDLTGDVAAECGGKG
jgi:hypothetical protein